MRGLHARELGKIPGNAFRVAALLAVSSLVLALCSEKLFTIVVRQPIVQPSARPPAIRLSPGELKLYQRTPTLIDWTSKQIRNEDSLHGLHLSSNQNQLPDVLKRVGQTVYTMFADFPQVSCDEGITSEVSFKVQSHKYRYIVIPKVIDGLLVFDEYRTDLKGNPTVPSDIKDFFMVTYGFVSTSLYLSPDDQTATKFRDFGYQKLRNRQCHVLGFAQNPEQPTRCVLWKQSVALLLQGLVWIDAKSLQILRVKTWLLAPREDLRLTSLISTVDFYPTQPIGTDRELWLPRDVTVDGVYGYRRFYNTHHYYNFKLFRVESTIKAGR